MTSDKAISKAIFEKTYTDGAQKQVLSMMARAAAGARADERRRILKSLSDQHDMIAQKRKLLSIGNKLERFKLLQSMRTIDAMMTLIGGGKEDE